jgi:uncharacterized glyoxalase superfamily protein PhnB
MIMPFFAVQDVDESIKFYTEKLGFKQAFAFPGPDGTTATGAVTFGTANFGFNRAPDVEQRGNGVIFMTYLPDEVNLDTYYADVQKRGVKIVEPIKTEYWGDRTFRVDDPDGYILYLSKTEKPVSNDDIAQVVSGEKERP